MGLIQDTLWSNMYAISFYLLGMNDWMLHHCQSRIPNFMYFVTCILLNACSFAFPVSHAIVWDRGSQPFLLPGNPSALQQVSIYPSEFQMNMYPKISIATGEHLALRIPTDEYVP